jgi:large subunit ribosomal protein L37Ae
MKKKSRRIRKLVADIEEQTKSRYKCPRCKHLSVKKVGTGIWKCTKCDLVFAGGTYTPQTPMGKTAQTYIMHLNEPK